MKSSSVSGQLFCFPLHIRGKTYRILTQQYRQKNVLFKNPILIISQLPQLGLDEILNFLNDIKTSRVSQFFIVYLAEPGDT